MAATEEVWLPREVHNNGRGSTYRNDGECQCWNRSIYYIWGQARLCTGPTLFSVFLSASLDDAFRDMRDDVYIQSRQRADLFLVGHFRAKTKTTRIMTRELLFADDSALVAHSAEEMPKTLILYPMRQRSSA